MNRLLKSSKFWVAIIGSIFMWAAGEFSEDPAIVNYVFILFAAITGGNEINKMLRSNKGIVYDHEQKKDIKL